ncbi:MAG: hypothetical protein V1887_00245, partial [Candidatus Aenigmatarchaeota archaeon]
IADAQVTKIKLGSDVKGCTACIGGCGGSYPSWATSISLSSPTDSAYARGASCAGSLTQRAAPVNFDICCGLP